VVAPTSATNPDLEIVQVIMPAVSPVYQNNPGFGLLTLDDVTNDVDAFEFVFLQLQEYHRFGVYEYEVYDPSVVGGFDYNDAESVRQHTTDLMYDFQKFGYWQVKNYGGSDYVAMGGQFSWPFSIYKPPVLEPQTYQIGYQCAGLYYN